MRVGQARLGLLGCAGLGLVVFREAIKAQAGAPTFLRGWVTVGLGDVRWGLGRGGLGYARLGGSRLTKSGHNTIGITLGQFTSGWVNLI